MGYIYIYTYYCGFKVVGQRDPFSTPIDYIYYTMYVYLQDGLNLTFPYHQIIPLNLFLSYPSTQLFTIHKHFHTFLFFYSIFLLVNFISFFLLFSSTGKDQIPDVAKMLFCDFTSIELNGKE